MTAVKRALISCADKAELEAVASTLAQLKIEVIASGGTASFLTRAGLTVTSVESFAGIGEQLDGRVKTLHPKIYAGILARRDDPTHVKAVGADGLIDLVIVNLYPFEETIRRPDVSLSEAIEQIDVGGVALLRAAAKNFTHVAAVSSPQQYPALLDALRHGSGQVPEALCRQFATEAFTLTSRYDAWIAGYLGGLDRQAVLLPESVSLTVRRRQVLRYGENPHQQGAWYVPSAGVPWGLGGVSQSQGKELSFNNLLDLDAVVRCLADFTDPTCAIIKHASLCGLASDTTLPEAYAKAHACDPESAFGGVVGLNRPIDASLAERFTHTFLEVIAAPAVDPQAASILAKKPNLRVVTLDWGALSTPHLEWRQVLGGWLIQEPDTSAGGEDVLKVVTEKSPMASQREGLSFAWKAVKHVKSNGIVLAHDRAVVGIGQGQPSRVGSVRVAVEKAGPRAKGAVAASDGFFPFPDGVEQLAQAGVVAVVQPGGSKRDPEVIAAANRLKISMALTGRRHFRH